MKRARVVVALGLLLVSCSAVLGIDDLQIGACKGSLVCLPEASVPDVIEEPPVDAGRDASACPSWRGPEMVRAGGVCVDVTEVTVGQYRAFFAEKNNDTGGQPPECGWNGTYAATVSGPDDTPQTGVDWCDAVAFCKWAGKTLCAGKPAGDASTNAWLRACTNDGKLVYPYGSIDQPDLCNLGSADASVEAGLLPVKSKGGCEGGFPGLFGLLGNASEWTDSDFTPQDAGPDAAPLGRDKDESVVSGGSYLSPPTASCATTSVATRDRKTPELGFRCCAP